MVAHRDVEEAGAVARLGDAQQLGGPGVRLPRRREHRALRRHRQLHADDEAARRDDLDGVDHRPFAPRAGALRRMRIVLCTGSWSKRGITCCPNSSTERSATSCGCVEASTPKMIWSQPTSAYCCTAARALVGVADDALPAGDALLELRGRRLRDELRPRRARRPGAGRCRGTGRRGSCGSRCPCCMAIVARRLAVLEADERGDAGDVVVDVVADRLGVPDGVLVDLDQRREVLRRAEAEAERAEPEPAGLLEGRRAAARHPDRRVRLACTASAARCARASRRSCPRSE